MQIETWLFQSANILGQDTNPEFPREASIRMRMLGRKLLNVEKKCINEWVTEACCMLLRKSTIEEAVHFPAQYFLTTLFTLMNTGAAMGQTTNPPNRK